MCGGFGLTNFSRLDLEKRYGIQLDNYRDEEIFKARFSPKTIIPTISRQSPNRLVLRFWSIMPPWIDELSDLKFSTFNARAETLTQKSTFKTAWNNAQRCLIPATHFFEWQKLYDGDKIVKRQPFTIHLQSEQVFSIAGLFQAWQKTETCTIITTQPNADLKHIHDRMPVIIKEKDEAKWLDPSVSSNEVQHLLQPFADGQLGIKPGLIT